MIASYWVVAWNALLPDHSFTINYHICKLLLILWEGNIGSWTPFLLSLLLLCWTAINMVRTTPLATFHRWNEKNTVHMVRRCHCYYVPQAHVFTVPLLYVTYSINVGSQSIRAVRWLRLSELVLSEWCFEEIICS